MEYKIEGKPLPVVICQVNSGETMITERGSMSWMSPNMKMETTSGGGVGKALGQSIREFKDEVKGDEKKEEEATEKKDA